MLFNAKESPDGIPSVSHKCTYCEAKKKFTRGWRMDSNDSRRGDKWGVLNRWAYHCETCGSFLTVRWWDYQETIDMFSNITIGRGDDRW